MVWISVSGCTGDTRMIYAPSTFGDLYFTARHFLGFPLYRLALLGIPTLPPAGRKKDALQRKPNFQCRRDKKCILKQQ